MSTATSHLSDEQRNLGERVPSIIRTEMRSVPCERTPNFAGAADAV